ncbi:MAG: phosphoenolpyruvate carboxylase, partial [Planctomycetales bacterium]|nr:phosphoenolpyruvate carboxylase [Planctomycetales bacterium]
WIGGDRDGNPYVTADVTRNAIQLQRRFAIEHHLEEVRRLKPTLAMSVQQTAVSPALQQALAAAEASTGEFASLLAHNSAAETYHRWMKWIEFRLLATLAADEQAAQNPIAHAYASAAELAADAKLFAESIAAHGGQQIVATLVRSWLDQIETFGFQFARMDVRQESGAHETVWTELLRCAGLADDYAALDEPEKRALLDRIIREPRLLRAVTELEAQGELSDLTRETAQLFRLLAKLSRDDGPGAIGAAIISMTHAVSDVLEVLALWRWAWDEVVGEGKPMHGLRIVPLLETIDDLEHAGGLLNELLTDEAYSSYLGLSAPGDTTAPFAVRWQASRPEQMVMVGYSDSTKDGGYLAAVWNLNDAQRTLAETAQQYGVHLVVFHGRGGALGRGGGPAARAILSLPPSAVDGSFRITEQGEVLAERFDDPAIAYRHLEQVTWATLLVSGLPAETPDVKWQEAMNKLADLAQRRYRQLIEDKDFLTFFEQGTPISEIERLPLGSRPARRQATRSLQTLRAIPWTFAWTQCRQIFPAWFGLGTAVQEFVGQQGGDWSGLKSMYAQWPAFRAMIDNAELALAKADMGIARRYAALVEKRQAAERIVTMISEEHQLSRGAVLMITGQSELLGGTPWLAASIGQRNPHVDPINFIQVELLKRLRACDDDAQRDTLRHMIRESVQGVAAGMRTTG